MKILVLLISLVFGYGMGQTAWKKTVTKGGKTTVTGDAETMAQVEKNNQAKAAYRKEIAEASRRAPTDPIRVTLLNPLWDGQSKNPSQERANKMLFDELIKDPLFRVTMADIPRKKGERGDIDILVAEAAGKGKGGDVYIHTVLGTEAALGKEADGKMAVGNAIALKAEVRSAYGPESKKTKELGNLLQTNQMVKNIAKSIGDIIKLDLGPGLPSPAAVSEINKKHFQSSVQDSTGIEPGDDTKTILKKLFKPKHPNN